MDCGLEVWQDECDRLGSPLSSAEIQQVYQTVLPWAAQALATGVKETELGKTARGINNLFNIFDAAGSAPVNFPSWEAGAASWKGRFTDLTYKGGVYAPQEASIEQIIATYQGGPGCWDSKGASCANGETWQPCSAGSIELSIQQFCARCSTYMGLPQEVPWVPVPGGAGCEEVPTGASPVIYTLPQDAARFGISQQCANYCVNNRFESRSGSRITSIFIHVQEGSSSGSLGWWCSQGIQASATVMIQHDGSILQIVPEQHGPWTNGDACSPTARGSAMMSACGNNPNCCSLTIETEGYYNQAHEKRQIDAIVWQCRQWMGRYGLSCANIYAHRDVNQCSRPNCCGSTIFNAAMSALGCPQRY
jgi:N-acetyl-anhydromuramyl-L-alanine amidase AmpD